MIDQNNKRRRRFGEYKSHPWVFLIFLNIFILTGISAGQNVRSFQDIIGYWKSYPVEAGPEHSTWIKVSTGANGKLMQAVIYETGTQCRIWINDHDIQYKNGRLKFWGDEFDGRMSADKHSIRLYYKNRFGEDIPFLWEKLSDPAAKKLLDDIQASQNRKYSYRTPFQTDDHLICTDLRDVHILRDQIDRCVTDILGGKYNDIHSLLIAKDGKLVLEEYFGAGGKIHGPMINDIFRDRCQQQASVTKSFNAVLIGIAIDKGFIKNIDSGIVHYFPEYRSFFEGGKKRITIRHLLTMSAGLAWNENLIPYSRNQNDAVLLQRAPDMIAYVLKKSLAYEPGKFFTYNSGLAVMLGEILKRASGLPADRFAEKYLFEPLGIKTYEWSHSKSGLIHTDGGLALRARDMIKLGLLFLNRGKWKDQQLVSGQWVTAATSEQIRRWGGGYGYQWWTRTISRTGHPIECFYAIGYGGQFITVIPEFNLIMVTTAQDFSRGWASRYFSLFDDLLRSAVE